MKKILKKLSTTISLALAITMIVPSTLAYAEEMPVTLPTKPSYLIEQTEPYAGTNPSIVKVLKVGEELDYKFVGVADYRTTGKNWKTTDETVATVTKAGVVKAVKPGITAISYEATGYTCTPVSIVVIDDTVKEISVAPSKENIKDVYNITLDDSIDFNFYGVENWSQIKNSVKCSWISSNSKIASIDYKGLVTPHSAGEVEIVFAIRDNGNVIYYGTTKLVVTEAVVEEPTPTPTPEPTPTPIVDAFEVKQVSDKIIEITFNNKQNVDFSKFVVNQIFKEYKFEIALDNTNLTNGEYQTVQLKFYNSLTNDTEYEVCYNEEKQVFKASVGTPTSVDFRYETYLENAEKVSNIAYVSTDSEYNVVKLVPVFYDANGINVTNCIDMDRFYVYYTVENNDSVDYTLFYDEMVFNNISAAKVTVTATTYEDDKEIVLTNTKEIVAIPRPVLNITVIDGALFDESITANSINGNVSILEDAQNNAYGYAWTNNIGKTTLYTDSTSTFVARLQDNRVNKVQTSKNYTNSDRGYIEFKSSNERVFIVSGDQVIGINPGVAQIKIYWNDIETDKSQLIGIVPVTVVEKQTIITSQLDKKTAKTMYGSKFGETKAEFTLTINDLNNQLADLENGISDITITSTKDFAPIPQITGENGVYKITVDTSNVVVEKGTMSIPYTLVLDKNHNSLASTNTIKFTVLVYAQDEKITKWEAKQTKNSIDLNVNHNYNFTEVFTNTDTIKTVDFEVYAYNTNGFKVSKLSLEPLATNQTTGNANVAYYTIQLPTNAKNYDVAATGSALTLSLNTVENDVLNFASTGTYSVAFKIFRNNNTDKTSGTLSKLSSAVVEVTNSFDKAIYNGYRKDDNGDRVSAGFTNVTEYTSETDSTILKGIANALSFSYYPEVKHSDYDMGANMGNYANDSLNTPLCQIVSANWHFVKENKILVKDVTLLLGIPTTDGTIVYTTQTIKGINTYVQNY